MKEEWHQQPGANATQEENGLKREPKTDGRTKPTFPNEKNKGRNKKEKEPDNENGRTMRESAGKPATREKPSSDRHPSLASPSSPLPDKFGQSLKQDMF